MRRTQLEENVRRAKERLDNASESTPEETRRYWRKEYHALSSELSRLYEDEINEFVD